MLHKDPEWKLCIFKQTVYAALQPSPLFHEVVWMKPCPVAGTCFLLKIPFPSPDGVRPVMVSGPFIIIHYISPVAFTLSISAHLSMSHRSPFLIRVACSDGWFPEYAPVHPFQPPDFQVPPSFHSRGRSVSGCLTLIQPEPRGNCFHTVGTPLSSFFCLSRCTPPMSHTPTPCFLQVSYMRIHSADPGACGFSGSDIFCSFSVNT